MPDTGQITCNGETFQKWASDPRFEILSVETPKPGVYRFTPRLKSLSTPQSSNGESQSRPFPARPVKIMESAGQYTQPNAAVGSGDIAEKQNECAGNGSGQTNHSTDLDLPAFGNASPQNPSGVVSPQEQTPNPHVPAGQLFDGVSNEAARSHVTAARQLNSATPSKTLSQRIELLPAEIADFMLRVQRMEIAIIGQMPHPDGRRTVFEYVEASKCRPEHQNAPEVRIERLQAICEVCQGPLETDGTCNICAVGDRIFNKARQNRRAYHEMKKAGL